MCGIPKSKPCSRVDLLRPISLTSTLSKIQESYVNEWIYEDVYDKISSSQFGGLPGTSTIHALIYLLHKWHMAMESPQRIVRITFLDFRKAFDLINHNVLLENFMQIGVRPAVVGWFASYLYNRSQVTSFHGEQSDCRRIKGGVPQGSKLGPIAFIIKINQLPTSIIPNNQDQTCNAVEDQDVVMFMDDTTLSEVINVSDHLGGISIGNTQMNVDKVVQFAKDEGMELNYKKCMEMIIDFRKNISPIPPIYVGGHNVSRTKSYKLLGIWLDYDLKWKTNTEYIIKKATKRLYLIKILKSYGAPMDDLLAFYCSVIRPILEYGAEIWNGGLTQEQKKSIERIQKRVLKIIYPNLDYDQAITETKLQTLEERRDDLCVSLIKKMLEPNHKLHSLLPKKLKDIRQKETRTSSQKLYNFPSKTERFKHSPLVYCIYLYNSRLVD